MMALMSAQHRFALTGVCSRFVVNIADIGVTTLSAVRIPPMLASYRRCAHCGIRGLFAGELRVLLVARWRPHCNARCSLYDADMRGCCLGKGDPAGHDVGPDQRAALRCLCQADALDQFAASSPFGGS